jgi:hypothetical protein
MQFPPFITLQYYYFGITNDVGLILFLRLEFYTRGHSLLPHTTILAALHKSSLNYFLKSYLNHNVMFVASLSIFSPL